MRFLPPHPCSVSSSDVEPQKNMYSIYVICIVLYIVRSPSQNLFDCHQGARARRRSAQWSSGFRYSFLEIWAFEPQKITSLGGLFLPIQQGRFWSHWIDHWLWDCRIALPCRMMKSSQSVNLLFTPASSGAASHLVDSSSAARSFRLRSPCTPARCR